MTAPEAVKRHPNASTAGGVAALTVFPVWLLGHLGVNLGAEDASVVTGAFVTVSLLIGKRGFRGCLDVLWRGSDG